MTPFYLYENSNDALSTDSVQFKVNQAIRSLGFANAGQDTFVSNIKPLQESAIMDAATFKVTSGTLVISSDASGTMTGDGTGTFNATTVTSQWYSTAHSVEIIATVDVSYSVGSTVSLGSNTNGLPFKYTLPNALGGDSIVEQDPVSMFIVDSVVLHG